MTSVLIVDSDPIALELLQRAFQASDGVICVALDPYEAARSLADHCRDCDGLIVKIDSDCPASGWDLARIAREVNPEMAIGYLATEGLSDWAAFGVPNSVLINRTIEHAEIVTAFLQFCQSPHATSSLVGQVSAASPLKPAISKTSFVPASTGSTFATVDWSATALGPPETWSPDLQSWMRFLRAAYGPVVMLWGKEQVLLYNEPFRLAFGQPLGDRLGGAFVAPEAGPWLGCVTLLRRAIDGRSGTLADLQLPRRTGNPEDGEVDRIFDLCCTAIHDPADGTGAGPGSAICSFTEMTTRGQSAEIVRTERDELHNVLMHSPGFVAWLEGPEHRFAFANTAYHRLVERDVIGLRVIDIMPEIEGQGYIEILDRIYRTGEPFMLKGAAAEFHLADGMRKPTVLDLTYHAVRTAAGTITGIFVLGEDVTEQHRAQQRIGVLQNELIHISRINAMGMMVSTIAHELNQPLTTIYNYMTVAKLVVQRDTDDPLAGEALQGAADAALRAGDVIRNLRAMTTRREVQHAPVLLAETLREAAGLALLGQSNVQVTFDLPSLTVQGDKILIQQIVFNLVRNALEAADGADVEVTIAAAEKGPVVEICVSDTGPGIDRTVLPDMFDSFITTKPGGTGIGLSICKAIVEAHGGIIAARNGPERGAIFCFTLAQIG